MLSEFAFFDSVHSEFSRLVSAPVFDTRVLELMTPSFSNFSQEFFPQQLLHAIRSYRPDDIFRDFRGGKVVDFSPRVIWTLFVEYCGQATESTI